MNAPWKARRMVHTVRAGALKHAAETRASWYEAVSHQLNGWGIVTKERHRIACVKGDDLVFFAPDGADFDAPSPLTPVEHAQALITASVWASAHEATPTFAPSKTVRIVVGAFATCDDGDGPMYALFRVNEAWLAKLDGLRAVCKIHDLTEARIAGSPDWAPGAVAQELRLQNGELVVLPDGAFWFTDYPKYGGYQIETRALDIAQVREALNQGEEGTLVFLTDDDAIKEELEASCGDCPNCGAKVYYEEWMPIDGQPSMMGCPRCKQPCEVDSVYPTVDEQAKSVP